MKTKKKLIGYVGVDTGRILIADPVYAADASEEAIELALNGDFDKTQVMTTNDLCSFPSGVVAQTGFGDGVYPVYAHYTADGMTARITIDFELGE